VRGDRLRGRKVDIADGTLEPVEVMSSGHAGRERVLVVKVTSPAAVPRPSIDRPPLPRLSPVHSRRIWPGGERAVHSATSAQKRRERAADTAGPRSYRESHLGAEKARSYDEDLWDSRAAKGLDWLVEQRLLADILQAGAAPGPRSAADFACGTGRVLEFLGRYYPSPVGIDISPDMLALAHDRCPRATVILGDVTTMPGLAPGPFDLITAFRFFLNAEPSLQSKVLEWMRDSLRPGGLVVANFHLNPCSLRGAYLRLRTTPGARPSMASVAQARWLFTSNGFTVRMVLGYSFLPYRRAGRTLLAPPARRAVEMRLAGSKALLPVAGSFLLVAALEPSGLDG
jgi:SAM-dependent methyltransferase